MLGKRLSESMSDIGDDLIADAMEYRAEKKRNVWLRVAAVAAVVALVIGMMAALWDGTEPGEQMGMPTVGTTVAPTELPTTLPEVPTAPTQGYELVKMSGVLKVYAYDMNGVDVSKMTTYELTEGVVSHPYEWTFAMNSLYGLPLTLRVEDELWKNQPLTFYVETEYGGYYGDIHNAKYKKNENDSVASLKDVNFGNAFEVENGETIFWTAKEIYAQSAEKGISPFEFLENIGNTIYTRIIIRCEDHIVGYAMVKITHSEGWYTASVVRSVFYPLVDGQFQQITEEYVRKEMQNSNML